VFVLKLKLLNHIIVQIIMLIITVAWCV